jgi:RimJ/RimL family protein N-acetyltransferase
MWAVDLIETGELIGHCGIQPLGDTGETEIGWMLVSRHWGKGMATEAARAVLRYAMNDLGFKRIVAITHPENRASSKIMEKIGMSYEKTIEWRGVEGVLMYAIEQRGSA